MDFTLIKDAVFFPIRILCLTITTENYRQECKHAVQFAVSMLVITLMFILFAVRDFEVVEWIIFGVNYLIIIGLTVLCWKIKRCGELVQQNSVCSNPIYQCIDAIRAMLTDKESHDTEEVVRNLLTRYDSYKKFIKDFKEFTNHSPKDLNLIFSDAKNADWGRFECVVANREYYTGGFMDDDVKGMILYFVRHYALAEKHRFSRFFSLPMSRVDKNVSKCLLSEGEKSIFLCYVICNLIAGVETFVLCVYEQDKHDYFSLFDYVIGQFKREGKMVNKVYFSYAFGDSDDKIICTEDCGMINLLQRDFDKRRSLCNQAKSRESCLKIVNMTNNDWCTMIKTLGENSALVCGIISEIEHILETSARSEDNFAIPLKRLINYKSGVNSCVKC